MTKRILAAMFVAVLALAGPVASAKADCCVSGAACCAAGGCCHK